jgi:hypothetical protein
MRKNRRTTKLKLNQETLRALTAAEKGMAVGGATDHTCVGTGCPDNDTGPAHSCATSCACTQTCYTACATSCYSSTGFCW